MNDDFFEWVDAKGYDRNMTPERKAELQAEWRESLRGTPPEPLPPIPDDDAPGD